MVKVVFQNDYINIEDIWKNTLHSTNESEQDSILG